MTAATLCPTCLHVNHLPECPEAADASPEPDDLLICWEMDVHATLSSLERLAASCPVCCDSPCPHTQAAQAALAALKPLLDDGFTTPAPVPAPTFAPCPTDDVPF